MWREKKGKERRKNNTKDASQETLQLIDTQAIHLKAATVFCQVTTKYDEQS